MENQVHRLDFQLILPVDGAVSSNSQSEKELRASAQIFVLDQIPKLDTFFQYQNYLEFIRSICLLNFQTEWDAMRIPSTKRICFVGNYDSNSNLDKIDALLAEKEKFKPRDIKGLGL